MIAGLKTLDAAERLVKICAPVLRQAGFNEEKFNNPSGREISSDDG